MNDLNTINQLNLKAVSAAVPRLLGEGWFVVLRYSGLHFIDQTTHRTEQEAAAKALEIEAADPSAKAVLMRPRPGTSAPEVSAPTTQE